MLISNATPRVSVIIPTYNCDRYLGQAIASVLQQTYTDYELIVVDDGSTDTTRQVVQQAMQQVMLGGSDRLRYCRQANQGVSAARNRGIALAQGELVAFLDADDWFLPTKLEAQIAVFDHHPHLGMVHSGWRRVSAQGEPLMEVEPWHTVPHLTLETWLRWKPVLPSAIMIRRDWLEQSGGFDPRFSLAEDTELILRLALMGCEADWLRQVTVCYRQHDGNAMHQGLAQARSLSAVLDHIFARPDLPDSIRRLENQVRYSTLVWIAWYLHYTGHSLEMVDYLKRSWQYTSHLPLETVVHWADSFAMFSQDWGKCFDAHAFSKSQEWQKLMQWVLANSLINEPISYPNI